MPFIVVRELGTDYRFSRHHVYNLMSDRFIEGHSDVTGDQVAYAILQAVASV